MARSVAVASDTGHGQRKRKAHQKSKRGCRNCKLRRVKCDEAQPGCKKCSNYGVSCNYDDPHGPELQPAYYGATFEAPLKKLSQKQAQPMASCFVVNKVTIFDSLKPGLTRISDDGGSTIEFDSGSLARLHRFVTRTIFSVGSAELVHIFQADIVELVCGYPYLMHMVQALTALHDRLLLPNPNPSQTLVELYHASQAAAIFNAKLSQPLQTQDRDPLWVTAVLLGIASMCWLEASGVEDCWPLTRRKPTDLDWIRLSRSKAAVWELTDPMRKESRFHLVAVEQLNRRKQADITISKLGFHELPLRLLTLCEVDDHSTIESNPYLLALMNLAPAMGVQTNTANLLILLAFLGKMSDSFRELLKERDPRALLLMAYWYAKIHGMIWWLDRRSELECQAICMYLEGHYPQDAEILDLLSHPKMRCGLL